MRTFSRIKYAALKENNDKWFLVLLLIYTYICGSYIPLAKAAGLSLAEYVLLMMSNHYYVIYGLTIYILYWIFVSTRESGKLELLRYKTYRRYYAEKELRLIIKIALLMMAHILIAFIIGSFSLKISNQFSGHTLSGYYSETLAFLLTFQEYFAKPAEAVLLVSLYLMAGLCFVCELVFFVYDLCGSRMAILAMFLIIVDILLGFKLQIDESWLEVFFLNNYIILHHPLFLVSPAAAVVNIAVMSGLSFMLYRMLTRRKQGDTKRKHKRNEYVTHHFVGTWKAILLFSAAAAVTGVVPALAAGGGWLDCIFALTAGISKNGVQFLSFLYYLAFFIFPVFIADMFYEKVKADKTILARFRYQREKNWSLCVISASFRFLLKYVWMWMAVQWSVVLVIKQMFPGNDSGMALTVWDYYGFSKKQLIAVIILSFIMKLVELIVLFTFHVVCIKNLRNTTAAFFLTYTGYGILLLTQGYKHNFWNYCGNASVYQMLEESSEKGLSGMITGNLIVYLVSWAVILLVSVVLNMSGEGLRWRKQSSCSM